MNLADFYNSLQEQNSLTKETVKVYPAAIEFDAPITTNIIFRDGNLVFDMNVENENIREYDFVKFLCLSDEELTNLQLSNFPEALSLETQRFIFGENRGDILKEPSSSYSNVTVPLKSTQGREYKILIVFSFNATDDGVVFLLSLSPSEFTRVKIDKEPANEFIQPALTKSPSLLSVVQDKTFTSDLIYSCGKDGGFSAFYALDASKMRALYSKFPGFLNLNDTTQFENYLYKTEFSLKKYDNYNYGYTFDETSLVATPEKINNIFVQNSNSIYFYQVFIPDVNKIPPYQALLKFFFNDITIGIAKQRLLELKRTKDNGNRSDAKLIMAGFYNEQIPPEHISDYTNINKISNSDFRSFVDRVVNEFSKALQYSQEKTVSNQNVASQYTSPQFSQANYFEVSLEQPFQKTVRLKNNKDNVFYSLLNTAPFKSISTSRLQRASETYISTEFKDFLKVKQIIPVSKFNIFNFKDINVQQSGIENRINCSDQNLKKDIRLETDERAEFLRRSTIKNELTSFSYLKSVGSSTSALLFEKINGETFDFIPEGQVVLARLDNYEEYYDSYFFIVNDGVA